MAKPFQLLNGFLGYNSKQDPTVLPFGYLVSGSQNVLTTDSDKLKAREGYTLFGAAGTSNTPIASSYEWTNNRGVELPIRAAGTTLEVYVLGAWRALLTDFSSSRVRFAEWWDNAETQDQLIFCNGTTNLFSWSGGVTTIASVTANTLTKQGVETWGEIGFLASGTRKVRVNGVDYTYTGGEGTTTLTGVTPDPTANPTPIVAGAVALQSVRTHASKPAAGYYADVIAVVNNQLYVGSHSNRTIYVSKATDFTDFAFTAPVRKPSEGAVLTLDGTCVALAPQEDTMYISAGQDFWYQVTFTLSSDNTSESVSVKRLKTSPLQAAYSHEAVGHMKNSLVFISKEGTLDTLGRIENLPTPQAVPLSDPIKTELENYDKTNCHVRYHKNYIYVALPAEGLLLMYNLQKARWEAPQTLPVRRLAVISGQLCGHSSVATETYKLFDGYTDNGNPISAIAAFSYLSFGDRANYKSFNEWYSEGYIGQNTTLNLTLNYEYKGHEQIQEVSISGADTDIVLDSGEDYSLGSAPLGEEPLGGGGGEEEDEGIPKFRIKSPLQRCDVFEVQPVYSSYGDQTRWELLTFGPFVASSLNESTSIKK